MAITTTDAVDPDTDSHDTDDVDAADSADAELLAAGSPRAAGSRLRGIRHSDKYLFGTMLVSALLSLVSAFVLSYDAVVLAANPAAELSCNINSVLSCGQVALSWQAEVFGFPNAFLGMACEPVVITIAVAALAGTKFPRWFMAAAQFIYLLGLIFAYWLFFQSSFVIHALCPWCLVITFGTTAVFMTLLHVNLRDNNFYLPPRWHERAKSALRMNLDLLVTFVLCLTIATIILVQYGDRIFVVG